MFCKKCGKQIKDGIAFCPYCGQKITIPSFSSREDGVAFKEQKIEELAATDLTWGRQEMSEQVSKAGRSKSLLFAVIIGILIIIIAGLVFMLYSKNYQIMEEEPYQRYEEAAEDLGNDNEDRSEMFMVHDEVAQKQPYEEADTEQKLKQEPEQELKQELVQEEQVSQYILPESNFVYLVMSDLEGLTREECRIARNELYARHGRRFDDEELQKYFDSCDWYDGTIAPADFDDSVLNEYETANRDLIVMYEEEQGYR